MSSGRLDPLGGQIACSASISKYVIKAAAPETACSRSEGGWRTITGLLVVHRRFWLQCPPSLRPVPHRPETGRTLDGDPPENERYSGNAPKTGFCASKTIPWSVSGIVWPAVAAASSRRSGRFPIPSTAKMPQPHRSIKATPAAWQEASGKMVGLVRFELSLGLS
jgi:hypothetical protein